MQRRLLLSAGIATTAAALAGCAGPQVSQYASEKPVLDLRTYFNGTLDAYGVFTDRSGAVVKRFTVLMRCNWNGDDGVLDEDFTYSDGTTQKRIWRMKHLGNGQFTGTADDVVGVARGEQRGNAFRWGYTLLLPVDGTSYEVQFDDWMYLMDEKVMLNKAEMSKFGFKLGEVTLSFVKRAPWPPIRDWRGLRVWLVGASSGIGEATASALHARGAQVLVSARKADALQAFVAAHEGAQAWPLDVTDALAVAQTASEILAQGSLDMVVYCAGHYREMRASAMDMADLRQHLDINYIGALNVLHALVPAFMAQGRGHISLISSVAGFRGLPKSLAYGPTKAALTNLAETLYLDLQPLGLGVSVVHPGFVQTPLTAQNQFSMPALITPEQAALAMIKDWERGAFDIHYPKRFTRWMKLLRLLPYRAYFPAVRRFTGL